jgi:hypothetical protein
MALINGQPIQNDEVQYAGKTLPQDKAAIGLSPVDNNVLYNGKTLPAQATPKVHPIFDPSNNPRLIIIGNTALPTSTNISLSGKKILAESQIIDGVSVYEHISRKAYEIEFKIMIYDASNVPVFPQSFITNIWDSIWLPNTVQSIRNTYLNSLHIQEIIIESIKPQPRLGSKIVDMVIKAVENQAGQSIIIPHGAVVISF